MPNRKWTKARRDKYMATMDRKRAVNVAKVYAECAADAALEVPKLPEPAPNGPSEYDIFATRRAQFNAEIINRVIELLAVPQSDLVAQRLLEALDRLLINATFLPRELPADMRRKPAA